VPENNKNKECRHEQYDDGRHHHGKKNIIYFLHKKAIEKQRY
jgi:hypothetical protein